jgi:putative PIN family toxin of toxin-antitoxin system
MKIVLDSNIWVSFAIGKRLIDLERLFHDDTIQIFVCNKLLQEVKSSLLKPKLRKYVSSERRKELMELMASCSFEVVTEHTTRSRDPNDDFLLDLAEKVEADFLITGDNDLLVLERHLQTPIITFNDFISIF